LIDFNTFLDRYYIDLGGAAVAAFVALAVASGLLRWRPTLRSLFRSDTSSQPSPSRGRVILHGIIYDVLLQKPVKDCSTPRWAVHFCLFWGFIGLSIATTLDAITNPSAAPLPLFSAVRVAGNVGGILFMTGVVLSIGRRALVSDVRKNSNAADIVFLAMLFATGITGFATEYLSDLNMTLPDSVVFWSHMVFVTTLLVTAPFTKFVHSIGRPLLLYAKRLAGSGD
jgi:hypothetical protein